MVTAMNAGVTTATGSSVVRYVHTRVPLYHTCKVSLRWRRSIHSCDPGIPRCNIAALGTPGQPCAAIHYGRCVAVVGSGGGSPRDLVDAAVKARTIQDGANNNYIQVTTKKEPSLPHSPRFNGQENRVPPKEDPPSSFSPLIPTLPDTVLPMLEKFPLVENPPTVIEVHRRVVQKVPSSRDTIPPFYFPLGQPVLLCDMNSIMNAVEKVFMSSDDGKIYKQDMSSLSLACNLPLYWKMALFVGAGGLSKGYITLPMFTQICKEVVETCHDNCARFVRLLAQNGRNHLVSEDFVPIIQDIVDGHQGLSFLQEAPEFHTRYINTVISRIFFNVNRSWSGRITVPELRHSNFLETLQLLEEEEDINQVVDFFSYEHFYVIYCKFWELDKDHDLCIDKMDLSRHNDHAISSRMIDRIFSGAVTRGEAVREGRMSYPDFVWFILSEEDKRHPRSIEYWFRCMDLDGDGVISMYEMEYFYEEQMQKMEALGIEKLPFEDALCQMLDLVKPKVDGRITLSDLKACKLTNIFYDTFFNLDKFLEHEQRDPFANLRDMEAESGIEMSDWEKYAAEEYEILVAEEGSGEQEIQYEDDFEADDDDLIQDEMMRLTDAAGARVAQPLQKTTDDIYNFDLHDIKY